MKDTFHYVSIHVAGGDGELGYVHLIGYGLPQPLGMKVTNHILKSGIAQKADAVAVCVVNPAHVPVCLDGIEEGDIQKIRDGGLMPIHLLDDGAEREATLETYAKEHPAFERVEAPTHAPACPLHAPRIAPGHLAN